MDEDSDARDEVLSESEAPEQVLDPLAEPIGTRGTQRTVGSEYEEEDARERAPEDGLEPEIPEDANLRISVPQNLAAEVEEAGPIISNSGGAKATRKT